MDQKIKKWLIEYLAVVRLKERNADKEAAATTVTREETVQRAETAALSMEVNPQAPLPVMCSSLWWFLRYFLLFPNLAHRSIYVVPGPGLVQALCKTSCIDPVILFDKDDKIGQSDIHWNSFAAVLEVFDLWGEAFGWGIEGDRWKKTRIV